jgi:hypothetical protein
MFETEGGNPKMALFPALPAQFDRAKYIEVAALATNPGN